MSAVSSAVDIANWALDLLDQAEIQALSENNKAARALNRQWPKTRHSVLAESRWGCAKQTAALSNDLTAPVHPQWSQRSTLPGDLISIIHLWDGDALNVDPRPLPEEYWDREGDFLHHNLDYPTLEYEADLTNVALYGPKLAEAMAYHLAASTAKKITGDVRPDIMSAYIQDKLVTAQLKEGHQGRVGENLRIHDRLKRSPLNRSRINFRISSV